MTVLPVWGKGEEQAEAKNTPSPARDPEDEPPEDFSMDFLRLSAASIVEFIASLTAASCLSWQIVSSLRTITV